MQLYHPLPQPTQEEQAQLMCALPGTGSARGCEEWQPIEWGNGSCPCANLGPWLAPSSACLHSARQALAVSSPVPALPGGGHPPRNSLRSNPCLDIWDLISTEVSSFFFFFFSKAEKSCNSIGINLPN